MIRISRRIKYCRNEITQYMQKEKCGTQHGWISWRGSIDMRKPTYR